MEKTIGHDDVRLSRKILLGRRKPPRSPLTPPWLPDDGDSRVRSGPRRAAHQGPCSTKARGTATGLRLSGGRGHRGTDHVATISIANSRNKQIPGSARSRYD